MNTATLHDGREVDSSSEEHRHECEARAILCLRTLGDRRIFLEGIEARRGKPAADLLRATMKALWDNHQARRP